VLLAQIGSFVPADAASIGLVDRIFTRVGAHDDLSSGQSTFMVEMNETASILNNATPRSLVILDEVGRGTSTYDGLALAWAVAEYLHAVGAKTLFATHYHHLNELEKTLPGAKNFRVAVKEQGEHIVWLRKIMPGGTDKSYGIQVARLAGVPDPVLRRAGEVLKALEAGGKDKSPAKSLAAETKKLQMTLFEAESHPVLDELETLDLGTLSPIEALTKLYDLQRKLTK
jgi:DNA mismatch repair protein MutS